MGHHEEKKHQEEEGGESVGIWYISFADMITLLLAFFVMLSAFSSYSRDSRMKLMEAFDYINLYAFFHTTDQKQSIIRHIERIMDQTPIGADKPSDAELTVISPPPEREFHESENAYNDKNTVRIPADEVFWGTGANISDQGKNNLKLVADYLKLIPTSKVIISMSSGGDSPETRVQKSLAIMDYMTSQKINMDRFIVSSTPAMDATEKIYRPFVEIEIVKDTLQ